MVLGTVDVVPHIGWALYAVGFGVYFWKMRRQGKVSARTNYYGPAPVSWFLWTVLDTVMLFEMLGADTVNGQIVVAWTGGLVVTVWSLIKRDLNWSSPSTSSYDAPCLVGVLACATFGRVIDSPTMVILSTLVIGMIALIPTLMNVWHSPQSESLVAWTLWSLSGLFTICTVPSVTLEALAQPISFFGGEVLVAVILWSRRA